MVIVGKIKSISSCSFELALPFKHSYYSPLFQLSDSLSFYDGKKVKVSFHSFNSIDFIESLKKYGKLEQKLHVMTGFLRAPSHLVSTDLDSWSDFSVSLVSQGKTFLFNEFFEKQIGKVLYFDITLSK